MDDIFAQASQAAQRGERLSRERDAYRYICAWDRGDHNTMCNIWDRALEDVELANLLCDIDTELIAELDDDIVGEDNEEEDKRVHEKALHLMKQYNEEA